MEPPVEGGCFQIRGPGETLADQSLASPLGRMGRMGRMSLAYACARAVSGFGGRHAERLEWVPVFTLPDKVPPYPPYPPFLTANALKRCGSVWRWMRHSSSLCPAVILPILPKLSDRLQEMVVGQAETTKSSERAMP